MDMDNMWEKIKKGLKDGAVMSVEKIEEYTKIGKLKVDELSAKRKIERNFLDIGERYYDLVHDDRQSKAADDIVIRKALANIALLNTEIAGIAEKIREVHKSARKAAVSSESADSEDSGV